MQKKQLSILLIILGNISACLSGKAQQVSLSTTYILPTQTLITTPVENPDIEIIRLKSGECATPPENLAYPVDKPKTPPFNINSRVVIPPPEWEKQISLPHVEPYSSLFHSNATSIIYQPVTGGSGYVWFSIHGAHNNGVFRYDPITKKLFLYNKINSFEAYPTKLIINATGEIFGFNIVTNDFKNTPPFLLTKFSQAQNTFTFIENSIFASNKYNSIADIAVDKTGKVWIALNENNSAFIIEFSSQDEKIINEFELRSQNINNIEVGLNQDIFILNDSGVLLVLNMETGEVAPFTEKYNQLHTSENFLFDEINVNLYLDNSARLWLSDLGLIDFSNPEPILFKIIRSPVFIDENSSPQYQYSWTHPNTIFESSDKSIWFSTPGLVRLDVNSGNWCLISTEHTSITEDQNGSLWAVLFSRVYKYNLRH